MLKNYLRRPETVYDFACDAGFVAKVMDGSRITGIPSVSYFRAKRMEIIFSDMGGANRVTVSYRGRELVDTVLSNMNPDDSRIEGKAVDVLMELYEEAHSRFAWENRN